VKGTFTDPDGSACELFGCDSVRWSGR
jgi:hypothetical protein